MGHVVCWNDFVSKVCATQSKNVNSIFRNSFKKSGAVACVYNAITPGGIWESEPGKPWKLTHQQAYQAQQARTKVQPCLKQGGR